MQTKVTLGGAGPKRRRISEEIGGGGGGGAGGADALASGEMLDADKELMSSFDTRFAELKVIDPPVADAAFKSHLTDMVTKLTALKTEMKTKRRSAVRRADKEQDPLAMALAELSTKADALTHLLKCS